MRTWAPSIHPRLRFICMITQLSRIMRRNRKEAYSRWAKFGLQKGLNLWWPPRLHTVTDFVVQIHGGKLMKSIFTWIQSHVHIYNEAAAIIELLQRPFCGQLHSIRNSMHAWYGYYCFLLFLVSRGISTAHSGCSLLYIKASTARDTRRVLFCCKFSHCYFLVDACVD